MARRPQRKATRSGGVRREGDDAAVAPKALNKIPGVVGRSIWFANRAGGHEQSLSIERLRAAIADAEGMLDPASLVERTLQESQALFGRLRKAERDRVLRTPTMIDGQGRMSRPKTRRESNPAVTAFSPLLDIPNAGYLFLPLGARSAPHLDIEDLIVAEVSAEGTRRLNHTFSYWPEQDLLVGRLWRGGVYQVHGWPRDPLLRAGMQTIARYWPFLSRGDDERIGPIAESLAGLLSHGMGDRQARELLGSRLKPPFVKHWWDRGVFEIPKGWQSIGPVPMQGFAGVGRVTQIAVHPTDGNILIAGSCGGGVWRTNNGGMFWWPTMQLQPTLTIGAVAISRSDPQIMYAASGEDGGRGNPAWSGVGLYRSSNGGSSWTLMTGVRSTRFSAIVVHPTRPDTVYLAGNGGLHKTIDGGLTWRTNPGMQSLLDRHITDVVVAFEEGLENESGAVAPAMALRIPALGDHVYVGVWNDGVYRSTAGGEQSGLGPAFTRLDAPNQLPAGSSAGWIKLAIGERGAHRSRFLAAKMGANGHRIFTTVDGGATWLERAMGVASATESGNAWCSTIAVDPDDENILYAGSAVMMKRTLNGGSANRDWVSIYRGIHPDQQDMAFDPNDSRRVFLANDGGVYRSSDRGDRWTFASGSLAITQFYDIDISEKSRQVVAGGAQDNGVYYRDDFGFWRQRLVGDGTQTAIDPTWANVFYYSIQHGIPGRLGRSVNLGASTEALGQAGLSGASPWVTILKLEPRDPITNPLVDRVMFVCGENEIFRSTDSGQTWNRVEDASGTPFRTSGEITALEFAISDPAVLYLGTSNGTLYRAENGGQQAGDWTRIDTQGSPADALFPSSRIQAIRVAAQNPNDVWLVFGGRGVSFTARPDAILNPSGISHLFRNRNALDINGWHDASGAFAALSLPDVPTCAVALDDWDSEVAYAGTDVGIFRTGDGGDTWAAFQDGLPRSPIVELRFNRRFRRLFAATMGRGIYVRDLY